MAAMQPHTSQPRVSSYGNAYNMVAAPLCQEEVEEVRDITQANMYRCSKQQIYNMAQRHLALCREHDIIAEVDSFLLAMATRTSNNVPAAYAPVILPSQPTYMEAVPAAKANESPATVKKPHTHTESKWTPREEAILDDYLVKTKGCRKNWIYCSQLIGTRSVSQCKSKYNNEKLKRPKRQMLGI